MLGKNRISRISHLDKLSKLDVLDLHSNNISKMENLSTLNELRVLNLAGNKISTVENIGALQSLTELNLRRNRISEVYELNMLPALQRLFLSNNALRHFEDVSCVFKIKFLLELALDGNPMVESLDQLYGPDDCGIVICSGKDEGENSQLSNDGSGSKGLGKGEGVGGGGGGGPEVTNNGGSSKEAGDNKDKIYVTASNFYRSYVIENVKTLRHFDLRRVTDEERRQASVLRRRIEDKKRIQSKKNKMVANRKIALKAAERAWAAQNGVADPDELSEDEGAVIFTDKISPSPINFNRKVQLQDYNEPARRENGGGGGGGGGSQGGASQKSTSSAADSGTDADEGRHYSYNEAFNVDSPERIGGFKKPPDGSKVLSSAANNSSLSEGAVISKPLNNPAPTSSSSSSSSSSALASATASSSALGSVSASASASGSGSGSAPASASASGPRSGYRTIYSSLGSIGGTNTAAHGSDGGRSSGPRGSNGHAGTSGWKGYFEVEAPIKKGDQGSDEGGEMYLFIYGDGFDCK